MDTNLSAGDDAVALLGNTLARALCCSFASPFLVHIGRSHEPCGQISGRLGRDLPWPDAAAYVVAQLAFGVIGAWAAHVMFDLPTLQLSVKARTGLGQWAGEAIATFGLILTIVGTARHRAHWMSASVALYITAAYWFTSSTSFANAAITIARSLSDTFAGIVAHDVPMFVVAQLIGAALGALAGKALFDGFA